MKKLLIIISVFFGILPGITFAAITSTNLTSGESGTTTSTYTTASITPSANKLILISIYHRKGSSGVPTPTVSGNGLTWVQVLREVNSDEQVVTIFRAMGASPTTGPVTIDFAGTNEIQAVWSVNEFGNVDQTGTNGSGAVVQSKGFHEAVGNTTATTITLSAFGSANNASYGSLRAGNSITAGSGETALSQTTVNTFFQTEWGINQNAPSWSYSSAGGSFVTAAALEIKFAAPVTTPTMSVVWIE